MQLHAFLNEYDDFERISSANNPSNGLNDILKYSPDIVFISLNENAATLFQMVTEIHQYIYKLHLLIGLASTKNFAYDAIKKGFFDFWLQSYNAFDIRKSLL